MNETMEVRVPSATLIALPLTKKSAAVGICFAPLHHSTRCCKHVAKHGANLNLVGIPSEIGFTPGIVISKKYVAPFRVTETRRSTDLSSCRTHRTPAWRIAPKKIPQPEHFAGSDAG